MVLAISSFVDVGDAVLVVLDPSSFVGVGDTVPPLVPGLPLRAQSNVVVEPSGNQSYVHGRATSDVAVIWPAQSAVV